MSIIDRFYAGSNVEKYDKARKKNPKWKFEEKILEEVLKKTRSEVNCIIDAPVGTGRFLTKYATKGRRDTSVIGVDYSSDMIALAKKRIGFGSPKNVFYKKDIIGDRLNLSADLVVCFRFLNLINWSNAAKVIEHLFYAAERYVLFTIRLVDSQYNGEIYIEDKIYLHEEEMLQKIIADSNFKVVKIFSFEDKREGDYKIIWCGRKKQIKTCRVNKNNKIVYTYGINKIIGKSSQVANNNHAIFIEEITKDSKLNKYFPKTKANLDYIDAEWIEGNLLNAKEWESVIKILFDIQDFNYVKKSSFDYVKDLVIPRFERLIPVMVNPQLYQEITSIIKNESAKYDQKISHPDLIPGNVIRTQTGPVLIDNELMCYTRHHRVDFLNMMYHMPVELKPKLLQMFLMENGIAESDFQCEIKYLSAIWAARQAGSFLVKNEIQQALIILQRYVNSQEILPFKWSDIS